MNKKELIESFYIDKSLGDELNFNPYYQLIQSGLGRHIKINHKLLISLGTNDYLSLANNSDIKKEAVKIIEEYGVSMCGTPIVIGQTDLNRKLEQAIAEFLKQGDALVFPSGYQANTGVFRLLANKDDIIIADKEIHSSLLNGMALTQASLRFFPHNNIKRLKQILEQSAKFRMRFIVLEGLYSTNGDIPPLDEFNG